MRRRRVARRRNGSLGEPGGSVLGQFHYESRRLVGICAGTGTGIDIGACGRPGFSLISAFSPSLAFWL